MDSNNVVIPNTSEGRQQLAATLLATGARHHAVAELLGIDRTTLCNWGRLPSFQNALQTERVNNIDAVRGQVLAVAGQAVAVLRQIMLDESAKDSDRVKAASTILSKFADVDPRVLPTPAWSPPKPDIVSEMIAAETALAAHREKRALELPSA